MHSFLLAFALLSSPVKPATPKLAETPQLRTADHIAPWIRAQLGDTASAEVTLCVAADGRVSSVALVRSSSYSRFDDAVMTDVAQWQFEPGASGCLRKTIAYHVK